MPVSCTRCKQPAQVSSPDPRCIPCFKTYLQKTFKTSLGRLGASGRPTTLAIALSGGYNSTALALLLAHYFTTLNPNPHAPPPRVVILCVTDSDAPAIVNTLAQILPGCLLVPLRRSAQLSEALRGLKDPTDVVALTKALTLRSLVEAADENGCDKLLLGTSATRAAADVLHATVTGRGTLVRDAVMPRLKNENVELIRPLRDLPSRLLVRYAMLELPGAKFVDGTVGMKMGLYGIVNRFVGEVGADNSASVHNVVRTGERLLEVPGPSCEICAGSVVAGGCCGSACEGSDCARKEVLCIGCRDCVMRDAKVGNIVNYVATERRRRSAREEMRTAIQEFML